jgi:GNAT superfamily N-acetyltransferase
MIIHREHYKLYPNIITIKLGEPNNEIKYHNHIGTYSIGTYVGRIEGNINNRAAIITILHVTPNYRNQGFGMKLLKEFLTTVYEMGIVHVELFDCSDNYRKNHNIYIKCGFRYTGSDNNMYANVRVALTFSVLNKIRYNYEIMHHQFR